MTKPEEAKSQSSAVQELRSMMDTLNSSTNRKRTGAISTASTETELQRILRRRKVTADQDASAGLLTSTESKSMPVLGTSSPQRATNAESGTQCGHLSAGTQDGANPLHVKKTSQSAEALRDSAAEEKAEPTGSALGIALHAAEDGRQVNGEAAPTRRGKDEDSSNC